MALAPSPTITDSVRQSLFIEALGGAKNPVSYLDRFPDTVYTKAYDSLLVKFLYTLLGPVGVGKLKLEFLEARLQIEAAGLNLDDIDSLYTHAFGFARLAEETYSLDAAAALLPAAQRAEILAKDAAFRNRAIDFLQGARAGGTNLGVTMVARSGLNRPVEAIENWRALYDRYADIPLSVPFFGSTRSTNEVIIVPRQVAPKSAVQTLSVQGEPIAGYFTLIYPAAQNWQALPVSTNTGAPVISVPDVSLFPAGAFVTLTDLATTSTDLDPTVVGWNHATLFAMSAGPNADGTINLAHPGSGSPANAPSTGNVIALVSKGQTVPIPYDATAGQVQDALAALPVIGPGDVMCSGGPLPDQPVRIQFAGSLSDQPVSLIVTSLDADKAVGIDIAGGTSPTVMVDNTGSPLGITATVDQTTVGIGADGQSTTIAPRDEYAMRLGLEQTTPLTTLITTQDGHGSTVRQEVNSVFAGSSRVEVLRYVTGKGSITWPARDTVNWIEKGTEHEAPMAVNAGSQHYQGFHNVLSVVAYTEAALLDPSYSDGTEALIKPYWNSLVGTFSATQQILVPGLQAFSRNAVQYLPTNAIAPTADPLVISTTPGGDKVIDKVYPSAYYSLPGIQAPTKTSMWASMERNIGTDYLEIDLGAPQAVNYLYFEASRVPFLIEVAYDALGQAPARAFRPVTVAPPSLGRSLTQLTYDKTVTNMWETGAIFFTNSLGSMIYTRFLRIGFTRAPQDSAFAPPDRPVIPYSIEIRNLRVGRNVSTPNAGTAARFAGAPAVSSLSGRRDHLFPSGTLYPDSNLFPH